MSSQIRTELRKVTKEIAGLKKKLAALEARKAVIEGTSEDPARVVLPVVGRKGQR